MRWLVDGERALPDLEVETYSWSVLPDEERPEELPDLVAGIAAEMRWAKRELVGIPDVRL